jgi:hypothetical protein
MLNAWQLILAASIVSTPLPFSLSHAKKFNLTNKYNP